MSLLSVPGDEAHAISCLLGTGGFLLGTVSTPLYLCLVYSWSSYKTHTGLCLLPEDVLPTCSCLIMGPASVFLPCVSISAFRVTDKLVAIDLSQEKLVAPCFSLSMHLACWVVSLSVKRLPGIGLGVNSFPHSMSSSCPVPEGGWPPRGEHLCVAPHPR